MTDQDTAKRKGLPQEQSTRISTASSCDQHHKTQISFEHTWPRAAFVFGLTHELNADEPPALRCVPHCAGQQGRLHCGQREGNAQ